MENAKTYIVSKLNSLVGEFPNLMIQYKFDSFSKEHLIKVIPTSFTETDKDYQKKEEAILFDFISQYPYDNLVFITEEDWIDIDKADETFVGKKYGATDVSEYITDVLFTSVNDDFFAMTIEEDFIKLSGVMDFQSPVIISADSPWLVKPVIEDINDFLPSPLFTSTGKIITQVRDEYIPDKIKHEESDNYTYALAA